MITDLGDIEQSLLRDILRLSADEQAVMRFVLDRILVVGRRSYPPWVAKDDARDIAKEKAEECGDAIIYTGMEAIKSALTRQDRMAEFRGALDDHKSGATMKSIEMVREFHVAFRQPILDKPDVFDKKVNRLRLSLLDEELCELESALDAGDVVGTLDALTDLQYVLDGAYLSLGLSHLKDAALAEVHRSNLSKLDSEGKPTYREDGKVTKGPRYSPPDLAAVIRSVDDRFDFSDEDDELTGEWLVNKLGKDCPDCAGPGDGMHKSGCPWTTKVPR